MAVPNIRRDERALLGVIQNLFPQKPEEEQIKMVHLVSGIVKERSQRGLGLSPEQLVQQFAAEAMAVGDPLAARACLMMNRLKVDPEKDPAAVAASIQAIVREVISCGLPGCTNTEGLNLCSRCRNISYCSREHQVLHWKQENGHKGNCKSS